jgi:hypothetical protein
VQYRADRTVNPERPETILERNLDEFFRRDVRSGQRSIRHSGFRHSLLFFLPVPLAPTSLKSRFFDIRFLPPNYSSFVLALRAYFYSGWAFLIPYLVFYLLYYWRKWPANSFAASALGNGGRIPALLQVYWALHAFHLALAALAIRSWWRANSRTEHSSTSRAISSESGLLPLAHSSIRGHCEVYVDALRAVAPWLLLTLIFAIPGVYLEWPSDPWEHLRRITEWSSHATVEAHSAGYKSFYFWGYSWVGWLSANHIIIGLNAYYVCTSMLLAWQYYLLAKTAGLDCHFAFLSVILNVLTFGNVCFSFYRYYGISSSVYAQLGAVALTRTVLAATVKGMPRFRHVSSVSSTCHRAGAIRSALDAGLLVLSIVSLSALIASNHHQGIGIAALGAAAVLMWRWSRMSRAGLWWLLAAILLINGMFLSIYSRSQGIETLRTQGFLSAWYGFNLLDCESRAAVQALNIIGFSGLLNLTAAILLLRRNHVIGWLTVLPAMALLLPIVALPLSTAISDQGTIVTFSRMLFSIPPCLALCYLFQARADESTPADIPRTVGADGVSAISLPVRMRTQRQFITFVLVCIAICLVTTIPSVPSYNNRMWHSLAAVPEDLQLRHLWADYKAIPPSSRSTVFVTPQAGTALLSLASLDLIGAGQNRHIGGDSIQVLTEATEFLYSRMHRPYPGNSPSDLTASNLLWSAYGNRSADWVTLGGSLVEIISRNSESRLGSIAQNPSGAQSFVFGSALVPLQRFGTYQASMAVRTKSGAGGTAYLGVAWYDAEGKFLESNSPAPGGAANPRGWNNGVYSYFGLVSQSPPPKWTEYTISFGLGERAKIPVLARYMRLGALLNYNGKHSAVLQLTGLRIVPKQFPETIMLTPELTHAFSPASQAAQLSRHWPAQQVATDQAGVREMREIGVLGAAHAPARPSK